MTTTDAASRWEFIFQKIRRNKITNVYRLNYCITIKMCNDEPVVATMACPHLGRWTLDLISNSNLFDRGNEIDYEYKWECNRIPSSLQNTFTTNEWQKNLNFKSMVQWGKDIILKEGTYDAKVGGDGSRIHGLRMTSCDVPDTSDMLRRKLKVRKAFTK